MSNDTDTAVQTKPWLKWAWFHFSMTVEEFDTFEEAIAAATDADEALHAIEGPMGAVDPEHVSTAIRRLSEEQWEAEKALPRPTHGVKVTAPAGRLPNEERGEAFMARCFSAEEAEAAAGELRSRFGDRVSVVEFGR